MKKNDEKSISFHLNAGYLLQAIETTMKNHSRKIANWNLNIIYYGPMDYGHFMYGERCTDHLKCTAYELLIHTFADCVHHFCRVSFARAFM